MNGLYEVLDESAGRPGDDGQETLVLGWVEMVEGEGPDLKRRLKTAGSVLPVLDTPVKDAAALRAQFVSGLRLRATLHRCLGLPRLQLESVYFFSPAFFLYEVATNSLQTQRTILAHSELYLVEFDH